MKDHDMRARSIKPGLYKSETIAECSIWARYLFPALWMLADREGRLEDRPRKIKAETFPYDDVDVDKLLSELSACGSITRYQIHGKQLIQINSFLEHQRPHNNEVKSVLPPFSSENTVMVEVGTTKVESTSLLFTESLFTESLFIDSLNPEKKVYTPTTELSERPPVPKKQKLTTYPKEFDKLWFLWPDERRKEKPIALREWKIACEKDDHENIYNAAVWFVNHPDNRRQPRPDGSVFLPVPYLARWLKKERWEEAFEEKPEAVEDKKRALAEQYHRLNFPEY